MYLWHKHKIMIPTYYTYNRNQPHTKKIFVIHLFKLSCNSQLTHTHEKTILRKKLVFPTQKSSKTTHLCINFSIFAHSRGVFLNFIRCSCFCYYDFRLLFILCHSLALDTLNELPDKIESFFFFCL